MVAHLQSIPQIEGLAKGQEEDTIFSEKNQLHW